MPRPDREEARRENRARHQAMQREALEARRARQIHESRVPGPAIPELHHLPNVSTASWENQAQWYKQGPSEGACATAMTEAARGKDYASMSGVLGLAWHFVQGWLDTGERDLAEGRVGTSHARFAAAVQHGRRVYDESLVTQALEVERAGGRSVSMLTRHLETRRPEYRLGRVRTREAEVAGAPDAPAMDIPEPVELGDFEDVVQQELDRAAPDAPSGA